MTPELTEEQRNIVEFSGNMKVNAVAGSGKTTIIFEHHRRQKMDEPALYVVFNRAAREEARAKTKANGFKNLSVVTAHSLAYNRMNIKSGQLCSGYTPLQTSQILKITGKYNHLAELIIAGHILKLVQMYCNSSAPKVRDVDYLSSISKDQTGEFVKDFLDEIYEGARKFLTLMYHGKIQMIHDLYLKLYQLSKPELNYKRIYFDESQDASEVMLDIVKTQPAEKIYVGDTHQRIYGWRFAVNSMDHIDCAEFKLSGSFRFGDNIAQEAKTVLQWKQKFDVRHAAPDIFGLRRDNNRVALNAYLARSNVGILDFAINILETQGSDVRMYFEGGFHSYLFGSENTSLYDVYNIYNQRTAKVRDPFIRSFETFDDLKRYIEFTNDSQTRLIVDIVEKYGKDLMKYIAQIQKKVVQHGERDTADYIFSTVHRCKGLEYDQVWLANDFIREKDVISANQKSSEKLALDKTREEINILYVAITRCKQVLNYNGRTII